MGTKQQRRQVLEPVSVVFKCP